MKKKPKLIAADWKIIRAALWCHEQKRTHGLNRINNPEVFAAFRKAARKIHKTTKKALEISK